MFAAATIIPALMLVVLASARKRSGAMISAELGILLPLGAWVVKTAVSQVKVTPIGQSSLQIGFFAIILLHVIALTVLAVGRRKPARKQG